MSAVGSSPEFSFSRFDLGNCADGLAMDLSLDLAFARLMMTEGEIFLIEITTIGRFLLLWEIKFAVLVTCSPALSWDET